MARLTAKVLDTYRGCAPSMDAEQPITSDSTALPPQRRPPHDSETMYHARMQREAESCGDEDLPDNTTEIRSIRQMQDVCADQWRKWLFVRRCNNG